ncbi:MAG: nuclear transport factor 2 family protein [Pseudomonadota bacterium]
MRHNLGDCTQIMEESRFNGARSTLYQWTEAVASGQVEQVLDLYAPDAILVPTLANDIIVTQEGRRRYFEFFLSDGSAHCTVDSEEIRVDQKRCTVTIGGVYSFCFQRPSGEETVPARFLFTFEEMNSRWLITGHHSSRCV